jgi:hypothetical protein
MASLTLPVKVCVPAANAGRTANPVHTTIAAIQTCNLCEQDINPPIFKVFSTALFGCNCGEIYTAFYGRKQGN